MQLIKLYLLPISFNLFWGRGNHSLILTRSLQFSLSAHFLSAPICFIYLFFFFIIQSLYWRYLYNVCNKNPFLFHNFIFLISSQCKDTNLFWNSQIFFSDFLNLLIISIHHYFCHSHHSSRQLIPFVILRIFMLKNINKYLKKLIIQISYLFSF